MAPFYTGAILTPGVGCYCSNWLTCFSLWIYSGRDTPDEGVIAIFWQTSLLTWATSHRLLGPRAWHTQGLAAQVFGHSVYSGPKSRRSKVLGTHGSVLSFILLQRADVLPGVKSESWANSPLSRRAQVWVGWEYRGRECKSQSENWPIQSRVRECLQKGGSLVAPKSKRLPGT